MLPKLRLVTFSCFNNAKSRVGILLDNKSVIDLSAASTRGSSHCMLQFIDDGKMMTAEAKTILKSPPSHAIINEMDVILKAPIPLPRRNVFCIGKNYSDHVAEVQKASTATVGDCCFFFFQLYLILNACIRDYVLLPASHSLWRQLLSDLM